ncbi:uncharacterized protein LOC129773936 [Toxorhynchites rutilus septentrionalis]|uniref:uncharacterized protein LOC129773936 n=1 Tax=Toxorhynchites rutilus septentrionalis TaxID=329112 RepID=UPI00247882FD|nr:uncharacterized protein LOC129773936 [Toxorhynchites rutilus septentrionalis]
MANLKQFMDRVDADRDINQLEGWKQRIETVYREFQSNRLELEFLFDDTKGDATDEKTESSNRLIRQNFELDYVRAYGFLTTKIRELNTGLQHVSQAVAVVNAPNPPQTRIKGLSQINKFSYLVASLTKDARKVIEAIELTDANYAVAWQLLEKRFNNKKLVVKSYIDSLFAIEPMKRECYESLTRLIDDFERNLCLINKVGIERNGWSVLLSHMVCSRLDLSTLRHWESLAPSKSRLSDSHKSESYRPSKFSKVNTVHTITNSTTGSCPFCSKAPHSPFKCDVFLKMAVSQRYEQMKKKFLCINCLSSSHLAKGCTSGGCRVCNQKHHPPSDRSSVQQKSNAPFISGTTLQPSNHTNSSDQSFSQSQYNLSFETQSPSTSIQPTSLVSSTLVANSRNVPATVLLQTAIVKVFGPDGDAQWARALLDPASQLCLITENMVQKLKLRRFPTRQEIGGVGNTLVVSHHAANVRIGSHCTEYTVEEPCHILKKITRELPVNTIDSSYWNVPSGITLADPNFDQPGPIDLLLGMELYFELLLEGIIKLGPEKPILQNTVFGWVASGRIGLRQSRNQPKVAHVCSTEPHEDQISRFWELESCWSPSTRSPEETFCEEHFTTNTFRDESGRFVVTLPKRSDVVSQLGSSKEVFDASCRTDSGISLNQTLMIRLHPVDYPLHRIRWRSSSSEPLKTFELTTVTYGTASAPYLATRCLLELSNQGAEAYPLAAKVLSKDFYMDDMLTGIDDVEEGQELCNQLRQLLQSGGFNLRKWASNSFTILSIIPPELREQRAILALESPSTIKTLIWEPSTLNGSVALFHSQVVTNEHHHKALNALSSISIPRWAALSNAPVIVELHGFCDASERAYGSCLYIRTVSQDGSISVRLLTAKSRVAPLGDSKKQKKVSLPRLELSAALLLSHLYHKVNSAIGLNTRAFFWSDSTITLHWINSVPSRWKTFVANRVSEVQHLTTNGVWAHVSGMDNPADIISRGMEANQLEESSIWWTGPSWLKQSSRFWPPIIQSDPPELTVETLEERPVSLPVRVHEPNELFRLRPSFSSLVRLTAMLGRFIHNSKPENRSNRKFGFLRTSELEQALSILVKLAQYEVFFNEIDTVSSAGQVNSKSALKNLCPILKDGILRVGGRLRNATLSEDRKHPMILPARHPLTESIMSHYHLKHMHAGPQLLVACVREKFWPLRIRNLARHTVHSCISCFRCRPSVVEQIMGDLPAERVTPTLPFLNTGVDLCGPFKFRKLRKSPPTKCYVATFVCLVTKAIHIELVYDLSTAAFIAALHRFIARRGKPHVIHCDNTRNFKGAQHEAAVVNPCANDGIEFKFIPPRSPNFGGLWEAAVKSFKKHFRSTVGNSILSQDEFVTLLSRIEACLNSRPLTPLTADPNDLEVLTPGHFLVHRPLTSFPEPNLCEVPRNRLDRWQENQDLLRRVWKRWSTDYLSGLHPRTKWTQARDNIAVGTMVLLKEENLPPLKGRYGRITNIFRVEDNNIQVVSVKTAEGEFRRAISKVCVLPLNHESTLPTDGNNRQIDDH